MQQDLVAVITTMASLKSQPHLIPEFVPALVELLVDGLGLHVGVQGVAPVPQGHSRVASAAS